MPRAAIAVMRPSCPPPKIPIVAPGRIGLCSRSSHVRAPRLSRRSSRPRALRQHLVAPRLAPRHQLRPQRRIRRRQHCHGQQRSIRRARRTDRHRAHGHTLRHLHNAQQRIHPLQRRRRDRHAQHRHHRLRRHHARQMRRAARTRDDHAQPAAHRSLRIFKQQIRRPMRRNDARLMRHAELLSASPPRPASLRNHCGFPSQPQPAALRSWHRLYGFAMNTSRDREFRPYGLAQMLAFKQSTTPSIICAQPLR